MNILPKCLSSLFFLVFSLLLFIVKCFEFESALLLLQIQTTEAIQKSREGLDMCKEHHDNLLAEDKVRVAISHTQPFSRMVRGDPRGYKF